MARKQRKAAGRQRGRGGPDTATRQIRAGDAALARGEPANAEAAYRAALAAGADMPALHANLGRAALGAGKPAEAVAHHRRAVAGAPERAELRTHLAAACEEAGDLASAVAEHRAAVARAPDSAPARAALGQALLRGGHVAEAAATLAAALKMAPTDQRIADTLNRALLAWEARGDAGEVIALLTDVATATHSPELVLRLVARQPLAPDHPVVAPLQRIARAGDETRARREAAAYALGHIAHDAGDTAAALGWWQHANSLRQPVLAESGDPVAAAQAVMARMPLEAAGAGVPDPRGPVAVTGLPRSGKSLLAQWLARHPGLRDDGELDAAPDRLVASGAQESAPRGLVTMAELVWHLDRLAAEAPTAPIILVERDPADIAVACFMKPFPGSGFAWTTDWHELGRYIAAVEALIAVARRRLPNPCYRVSYADLVTAPEACVAAVWTWLGLASEDGTAALRAGLASAPVETSPAYSRPHATRPTDQFLGLATPYRPHLANMTAAYDAAWATLAPGLDEAAGVPAAARGGMS